MVPQKSKEVIDNLVKKTKKAGTVILATDEDREGEAIAWHLVSVLGLDKENKSKKVERIVFHEITKGAIEDAIKNPRGIDMKLVDAQQARRVLDRLVGYELSPFIWRKVRYGLSAGRVQSVAVRLIAEREREIQSFVKEEYWSIEAEFARNRKDKTFPARLIVFDGKALGKMDIKDGSSAEKITQVLKKSNYRVGTITIKEISRTPAPPFTTSTLQQETARKFGFSAKQTMVIAQRLYENGFITYMRTDSVTLALSATAQAKKVIDVEYGKEYSLEAPRIYATKSKGAQEAHEAIRPTDISKKSGSDIGLKDRGQSRLYELIWKRTVASQMQTARMEQTSVDITATDEKNVFRANGQVVKFDGFIRVYTEGKDENGDDEHQNSLPSLKEGESLIAKEISPDQHFTEPPARYTDATLIKALETEGVGRPSTYAPTLSTIQDRGYVEKIEKKYHPTEIGIVVNDMLVKHFPEIVDIKFTSHIEEELDDVAEGKINWVNLVREFYVPFKKHLGEKEEEVEKYVEISDTKCPHCGKKMLIKFGRMGKFLACPDPESKVTMPLPEEAEQIRKLREQNGNELCPLCGGPMDVKRGRFGFFLGCNRYPECKGISRIWNKTGFKCPNCLASAERKEEPGDVVEKKSRGRGKIFYACTRFPNCIFVLNKKPETEKEIEEMFGAWTKSLKDKTKKSSGKKGK